MYLCCVVNMSRFEIGDRTIGDGEPVFIIAEAGVNHNGDMNLARKLIDAATEAGVDAVKFQTFKAENLATRGAKMADYQKAQVNGPKSQYEMIKSLELDYSCFVELKEYSDEKGILFLSTPHTSDAAGFLDSLVPAHKIGSGDLTNLPFLKMVARYGKPIILSTGMGNLEEVQEAVNAILTEGNKQLVLLHCVTSYPAEIKKLNLRAMETMHEVFDLPVGFSDHTIGVLASVAAVALGACVIEKHFTLDKGLPGPDHQASLEPRDLAQLVASIRAIEAALGDGLKRPTTEEEQMKQIVRKSLVAAESIPRGSEISREVISIKRPGSGIAPKELDSVVGRIALVDIEKDTLLTWEMFE